MSLSLSLSASLSKSHFCLYVTYPSLCLSVFGWIEFQLKEQFYPTVCCIFFVGISGVCCSLWGIFPCRLIAEPLGYKVRNWNLHYFLSKKKKKNVLDLIITQVSLLKITRSISTLETINILSATAFSCMYPWWLINEKPREANSSPALRHSHHTAYKLSCHNRSIHPPPSLQHLQTRKYYQQHYLWKLLNTTSTVRFIKCAPTGINTQFHKFISECSYTLLASRWKAEEKSQKAALNQRLIIWIC